MKKELIDFIRKAKQATYASKLSVPERTKGGGKKYTVREGNNLYTDEYFGDLIDIGHEEVWVGDEFVWGMGYRGGMIDGKEKLRKRAFSFLKECISLAPKDFPVRGPERVEEGNWIYKNDWNGDIEGFVGDENIYFKKDLVCFRNYIGGTCKNK